MAGPLAGSAIAEMDGLMEGRSYAGVAEPGSYVADSGAIGVIEVVAGGEDFNDRAAVGRETAQHRIEEAGVQALLQEDVGRETGLHCLLTVHQGEVRVARYQAPGELRVCW